MGSVVHVVNSLFGHSPSHAHSHPDYRDRAPPRSRNITPSPQQPKRSRTPTRTTEPLMSQRAASASGSHTVQREDTKATPQAQPQRQNAPPPPDSPGLGAKNGPPSDVPTPAAQTNAAEARPARRKVKVRDLEHIQSFANEDMGAFSEIRGRGRSQSRSSAENESPQYEISEMKVEHIIEMVAGLLTKITTTNDQQHEHLHRQPPSVDHTSPINPQTSSVLAFHGKNVPSITILSYLSRINKYCPTSYEVFLSLLVYFDRMTERVNAGPMQSLREANAQAFKKNGSAGSSSASLSSEEEHMDGVENTSSQQDGQTVTPPASGSMEKAEQQGVPGTPYSRPQPDSPPTQARQPLIDPYDLSHFFVVDSFNIHRLVIAGVTCASKFFSDIFYTNSRYAKVGGLPLPELNHLELQFLLLNDFRLSVPVEEIEAYGTMLVEFYAREVVAQQKADEAEAQEMQNRSLSESSEESTNTVRAAGYA